MKTARMILKMTNRSIRSFFGRYLALFLIVFLSAGFFAGLKVTRPAMQQAGEDYLKQQEFYDFRLLCRTGFQTGDIRALEKIDGIRSAEGGLSADSMVRFGDRNMALRIHSLQEEVNLPSLTAGRMPEKDSECLADRRAFNTEDLGKKLTVDTAASDQAANFLSRTEFTIVGLCDSPMYLSAERDSSTAFSRQLDGYLYVPEGAYIHLIFTEADLTADVDEHIYSHEYDERIDQLKEKIEEELDKRSISAYILTRRENAGYLSFESDTAIVSGIANIFPLFFVMIGMLVCITAMTRMVEEERTQIGVLKALGYSSCAIRGKYVLYAGSAAMAGWAAGFFLGTWALPQIFWFAYSSIYGFSSLPYRFDPVLAIGTLAFVMAAILFSTMIAIRKELSGKPAKLIRPETAAYGKRILLEKIKPLWNKLSFLQKITLRNMFRYKQRLFMMLIGISCCCALVVTGFGVKDSLLPITSLQYDRIQNYQLEVSADRGKIAGAEEALKELAGIHACLPCSLSRVTLKAGGRAVDMASLYGIADYEFDELKRNASAEFPEFWDLGTAAFPGRGEAVICTKASRSLKLSPGDRMEIQMPGKDTIHVKVSGIFENYLGTPVIVGAGTIEEQTGSWEPDTILVKTGQNDMAEKIGRIPGVTTLSWLSETRKAADHALSCVNYIILMLVLFAGALEFVVVYNLTSIIGIPLGSLFHRAVINQIVVKNMVFADHIHPASYLFAILITVLFGIIVNLAMRRYIRRIPMAESLKAVE